MAKEKQHGVYFENFWGKKFSVISAIGVAIALVAYIVALPYMPEDADMNVTHPYFNHLNQPDSTQP